MRQKLSHAVAEFLEWAEKCRHRTTVNVYAHYFTRFLQEVGDLAIADVRPYHVTAWAKTWHQSQAMVRLFRWLRDERGVLERNPLERVQHPPKGQRHRIATRAETQKILNASSPDLRALLLAFRETWARPGELRAANWHDLTPRGTRAELQRALRTGNACIVLREYKSRKRRRLPNEPRVILLSPTVGKLIAGMMPRRTAAGQPIFTTTRGRRWTANALRCRMRRLRAALELTRDERGENIVPYTWRHTGATLATAAGIRDRLLADALGHTETSTTARYQHLQVNHVRKALQKIWKRPARRRGVRKRKRA